MTAATAIPPGEAIEALAAIGAALPTELIGSRADKVHFYAALEALKRRLDSLGYEVLADLDTNHDDTLGNRRVAEVVAETARLDSKDVRARMRIAADVTPRVSLLGEALPPKLEYVAELVRTGTIGAEHLIVIRKFFKKLPRAVEPDARVFAEQQLGDWATEYRPENLDTLAEALGHVLDPDGTLDDDVDRARKRHFTLHKQGADKMTSGSFCLTPEAAAYLEAYLAKFARIGMCNAAAGQPTIEGDPSGEAIAADQRTYGQRCHDAMLAMARELMMSGTLGQHRGLPVTVVLTADIAALDPDHKLPQVARTGGGLSVPITDLLRMAGHARLYLAAIFGDAQPVALFHGRDQRIASAGQRLMLHATDRGCTFPGCNRGAYDSQVHHAKRDWVDGGLTNVDEEALACVIHHPLAGPGPYQWKTRKHAFGRTLWIPPEIVDPQRKPRVNHVHHPERRIRAVS